MTLCFCSPFCWWRYPREARRGVWTHTPSCGWAGQDALRSLRSLKNGNISALLHLAQSFSSSYLHPAKKGLLSQSLLLVEINTAKSNILHLKTDRIKIITYQTVKVNMCRKIILFFTSESNRNMVTLGFFCYWELTIIQVLSASLACRWAIRSLK